MNSLKNYHNIFLICLSIVFLILCGIYGSADTYASATLQYKETDQGIIITKYTGKQASLSLPATIEGKDVVEIGESAFAGNIFLKTVTIPASLTNIEPGAFMEVGSAVFKIEKDNTNYTVVDGVLFTKDQKTLVAYPVEKSGSYEIPEGTETIGGYAFANAQSISALTIVNSVTSIDEYAFYNFSSEKMSMIIPETVKAIGEDAFRMAFMKELTLANTVTKIDEYAIVAGNKLDVVNVPDSVKEVGKCSFGYSNPATDMANYNLENKAGILGNSITEMKA